jgi:hypothetical protein
MINDELNVYSCWYLLLWNYQDKSQITFTTLCLTNVHLMSQGNNIETLLNGLFCVEEGNLGFVGR